MVVVVRLVSAGAHAGKAAWALQVVGSGVHHHLQARCRCWWVCTALCAPPPLSLLPHGWAP
jgi:hypothetical protein